MFIRLWFIIVLLVPAIAAPAYHYQFNGNAPALWSRSQLAVPKIATITSDFSVFPCGALSCTVARVVTDSNRNTYAVGSRTFGPDPATSPGDVFLAKIDSSGATIFLTTFSGNRGKAATAIALDPAGNIYVGGTTSSTNFPLQNPLLTAPVKGASIANGFLLKLSADGSQLIYSTYFGGVVSALEADSAGNVYVTGQTGYRDFPATAGMPNGPISGLTAAGVVGAFVTKLNPTGDKILYSGRISGNNVACSGGSSCFLSIRSIAGNAIGVDAAGNAYLAGNANVTDLPTTPGVLSPTGIGGWVARVNALGTKLDYLTYLGTADYVVTPFSDPGNTVKDLAVDAAGNAYIVGATSDPAFPATAGALQPKYHGPAQPDPFPKPPSDAFVAKLNPQGTAMVWATFLGGSAEDEATAIALDSKGVAYVSGRTRSSDFPLTTGTAEGGDFVAVLNQTGSALTFGARFPGSTASHAMAVDADGRLRIADPAGVVSDITMSQPLMGRVLSVTNAAAAIAGNSVAPFELVSLYGLGLGPATPVVGKADSSGRMPFSLGGTQILFDGVAAPLLYVSATQVNAVAPLGLTGKSTVVQVVATGSSSAGYPCMVVPSQPAIFTHGEAAVAVNQDGTLNSATNPAKRGSIVAIWVTGLGRSASIGTLDGQVASKARDGGFGGVLVNNESAEVLYAGDSPGVVAGVVQINFRLPAGLSQFAPQVNISLTPSGPSAVLYVAP